GGAWPWPAAPAGHSRGGWGRGTRRRGASGAGPGRGVRLSRAGGWPGWGRSPRGGEGGGRMIGRRLVRLSTLGLLSLAGAGCTSGTEPHIRPCTTLDDSVILAPAQYVSIDPAVDSGCAVFP